MPAEDWSENVYVVHLADPPAFGDELDQLERQVAESPRHVVLDLAGVTFLNSSNLAQLIRLRKLTGEADCHLVLAAVRPEVRRTFEVSGLNKLFAFVDGVPLALASVQLLDTPD